MVGGLVVRKGRFRLDVLRDGKIVKVFPVALGGNPLGAKRRQGDHKTPEGTYILAPHTPSTFGDCFYICYPNEEDARKGLEEGLIQRSALLSVVEPLRYGGLPPSNTALGGQILLHGTRDRTIREVTATNWTDGCIAMENVDLLELLSLFRSSERPFLKVEP